MKKHHFMLALPLSAGLILTGCSEDKIEQEGEELEEQIEEGGEELEQEIEQEVE